MQFTCTEAEKPVLVHCSGMAWTLEVLFQTFAASCCLFWVTTFEHRVELLVALQHIFLEFVVVFQCKNFSFLPGLLADFHAGVQFASGVLKRSIDLSNYDSYKLIFLHFPMPLACFLHPSWYSANSVQVYTYFDCSSEWVKKNKNCTCHWWLCVL